jgi:hypothetical protein
VAESCRQGNKQKLSGIINLTAFIVSELKFANRMLKNPEMFSGDRTIEILDLEDAC